MHEWNEAMGETLQVLYVKEHGWDQYVAARSKPRSDES